MSDKTLTIAISVGEASGDTLGAHLIEALKQQYPHIRFVGIAGPKMKALGCESLFEQERLAVRGFVEVIQKLPEILKIRKGLIKQMKRIRPDVFIGIDAPDFNLGVAKVLKQNGIKTIHYVSPSIWAWRPERVHNIVKEVDEVLCLFPMEPELYHKAGGRATYVGHPMAQTMPIVVDKLAMRERLKLELDIPIFTMMPGSRISEIEFMAPVFFQAAHIVLQMLPDAQFLLPAATAATREKILDVLDCDEFRQLPIKILYAHADLACVASDVVLVASGTATLEVALCKRPMVISYKIAKLTYWWVKKKINVPFVGLPNVLLNKMAVPELLQHDATPEKLAAAMLDWYEHPEKMAQIADEFTQLHLLLKQDTAKLAATAVLGLINEKN